MNYFKEEIFKNLFIDLKVNINFFKKDFSLK